MHELQKIINFGEGEITKHALTTPPSYTSNMALDSSTSSNIFPCPCLLPFLTTTTVYFSSCAPPGTKVSDGLAEDLSSYHSRIDMCRDGYGR